jgi:hypothetical protein
MADHFVWMDAINYSSKYGMERIAGEYQGQLDELGRELQATKVSIVPFDGKTHQLQVQRGWQVESLLQVEASLAYTAHFNLGALTVKYNNVVAQNNALKAELAIVEVSCDSTLGPRIS